MKRPEKRPDIKYNITTFLRTAYTHFVTDKSPRCTQDGEKHLCSYQGTGCWIGFILTEEDAKKADDLQISLGDYKSPKQKELLDILYHYFDTKDNILMLILIQGQITHDLIENSDFTTRMENFIILVMDSTRRLSNLPNNYLLLDNPPL